MNMNDTFSSRTTDLVGYACLVTGASSGIGRATCQVLTNHGALVFGTGRNERSLQELVESKDIVSYVVADLTQPNECSRVVQCAVQYFQSNYHSNMMLSTVINAAGVLKLGALGGSSGNSTDDSNDSAMQNYHQNMTMNCQVPYEIMIAAIPYLRQTSQQQQQQQHQLQQQQSIKEKCTTSNETQNSSVPSAMPSMPPTPRILPSIINVSSVNGQQSFANCATYCMSKAALDMMTRCASIDLAQYGIRVNAVNPGVIVTPLQMNGGMSYEQYQIFLQRCISTTHPIASSLGRVGLPSEVGELIAFLVSNKAAFMTGECIVMDGGRQNLGAR
jgi:NAD(P)-dependent dehydrogenase (short-subunit alcohol dehydrogenase family)